ncbi:hypothetical protein QAD02_002789 [Eretmocerus hayati]|uniref:Uncharacterized protein n=1 Tax=Eretmocerus hayati TaxID=131215 RepID=A0ACC2NJW7_9HYME|nr:hypothetical protein QAD02_002789 [Eretmocerus hayati]
MKLLSHNNEENRKLNKRKSLEDVLPAYKSHRLDSAQAGCTNWAPDKPSSDISDEQMEDLGVKLLSSTTEENIGDHKEAIQKTFSLQRKFINAKKPPSVQTVKQIWPCLFRIKLMFEHFRLLTNKNIDELSNKLSSQEGDLLLSYGHKKSWIPDLQAEPNLDKRVWAMIRVIHKQFNTEPNEIFTLLPVR